MVLSAHSTHLLAAREYAEALSLLIQAAAVRLHQPLRDVLLQHIFTLDQALGVGAPPHVNGVDRTALTLALQALRGLDAPLQRLGCTQALVHERQLLLLQLHTTLTDEVERLLHTMP